MYENTKLGAILIPIMIVNQTILGHPGDEICSSTSSQFGVKNARDLSLEPRELVLVDANAYQE